MARLKNRLIRMNRFGIFHPLDPQALSADHGQAKNHIGEGCKVPASLHS